MPLTTSKLRRLVRSKHPYVERNLSTVLNIIKHSAEKASLFEAVAEQLKEERMQVPELNDNGADFPVDEGVPSSLSPGESGEHTGCDLNLNNDQGEAFSDNTSKNDEIMKDDDGGTTNETNAINMQSQKVAQVTVQVLKKPNHAFGALLGSSGSKKKMDLKKKEDKLQQIKSTVNLPFYSFSNINQQLDPSSKLAPVDPNGLSSISVSISEHYPSEPTSSTNTSTKHVPRTHDMPLPKDQVTPQTSSTKLEDVIFLDNDSLSNDDAPPDPHPDSSANQGIIPDEGNNNDDDDDDESMSLSDLSSGFQKCLRSNQTSKQDDESKGSCLKFKPFDYEAARREVKFGENAKRQVDSGDNYGNGKSMRKKKGGDKSKQDENGLGQGKRRQAFPASGNRSATFR